MAWRLFDTSPIVDFLRGREPGESYANLVIDGQRDATMSVIIEAELMTGALKREERQLIATILDNFDVLHLTRPVAQRTGMLLRWFNALQRRAHFGDALIGATAIEYGEVVLTADASSSRVFEGRVEYDVYTASP